MNISLLGYMGSGKSLLSRVLAEKTNYKKIDLDSEIEKKNNLSIENIFKSMGEIFFRKEEHLMLKELLQESNKKIISTGGGTPTYYNNMELIKQKSVSFYLRANPMFLAERLKNQKSKRPLIAHISNEDLPEFIAKHLFERNPFYTQADYIIDIQGKNPEELALEIILLLDHHQH